jgi:nucleoside-diphosphate-sugar epimerase
MKIAIIGAGGRTGRVFVDIALEAGHSVVAGIHRKNPFEAHASLTIRPCDATDIEDVIGLIEGCDAIVSLIGHSLKSPKNVQTVAIKNIVQAMETVGCSRLVSLTGSGVREPGDTPNALDIILNASIGIIDPARIKDGIQHARELQDSSIDWTILRVLKLTNGSSQPYGLSMTGPAKLFAPRRDVAAAILMILDNDSFIKKLPILSRESR